MKMDYYINIFLGMGRGRKEEADKKVIVLEGKDDISAVKRAVKLKLYHKWYGISKRLLKKIEGATSVPLFLFH